MKSLTCIFCFLFLCSCASGVRLNSRFCYSKGTWEKPGEQKRKIELKMSGFGIKEISLREVFKDKGIKCENVRNLSVEVKRKSFQAFLSTIPGYTSQLIILRYDRD